MSLSMVILAVTLGLDVFAGGLSMGVAGLERRRWARTATLFAFIALVLTSLGVLFGRLLSDNLGRHASYIAGAGLLIIGARSVIETFLGQHDHEQFPSELRLTDLLLTGVMVCLDKLAVGVSLAFIDASVTPVLAFIVVICFVATLIGVSLGARLGARIGELAELLAGGIFILLGTIIIIQTAANHGIL